MIKELTKQFIHEEDGAGLFEYLILAALAAVIAIFMFPTLREAIGKWFKNMIQNVNNAISGNQGGTPGNVNDGDLPSGPSGW